jgi:hypothetical protein
MTRASLALLVFLIMGATNMTSATETATIDAQAASARTDTAEMVHALPTIEIVAAVDMREEGYNDDYIFGMTKGLAASTMVPALKPVFMIFTIPLDLVFLPFAWAGGYF